MSKWAGPAPNSGVLDVVVATRPRLRCPVPAYAIRVPAAPAACGADVAVPCWDTAATQSRGISSSNDRPSFPSR
ncbi:hypothetical protein ACFV2N_45835 [Streptomyces sp. NPDC059680]|uniref:hypothetical protein n=1 Tax=Streptomyces sp. NPDC059680 TaxID=3346904 RepID=UPI003695EEBA